MPNGPLPARSDAVRASASRIAARVGQDVRCDDWFWDGEDAVWECSLVGHSRIVELDITRKAEFSELEFVVSLAEIAGFAPHVAEMIRATCGENREPVTEVSIRPKELISAEPRFEELWSEPAYRRIPSRFAGRSPLLSQAPPDSRLGEQMA